MGGFFGITSTKDCLLDVFFGTDYHSHLGTARGGLAAYDPEIGLQRKIHSITNAPFRTKFETIFDEMKGIAAIGCISDTDPQPMLIRSNHGTYATLHHLAHLALRGEDGGNGGEQDRKSVV